MPDFESHKATLVAHYVKLAQTNEAWKQEAWRRVKEMAAQEPQWFADMPALLTAAMQSSSRFSSPSAPSAGSTSASTGASGRTA